MRELRVLADAHARTIVAVLHEINYAAVWADRIVALREGRLVAAGTPDEIVTPAGLHAAFGTEISVARIEGRPHALHHSRAPPRHRFAGRELPLPGIVDSSSRTSSGTGGAMAKVRHKATAAVATDKASGYLQQLCKHFGHKVAARCDPQNGSIAFPFGDCALAVENGGASLDIRVSAASPEDLERLKEVIGGHLERFAFREALQVTWQGEPPVAATGATTVRAAGGT